MKMRHLGPLNWQSEGCEWILHVRDEEITLATPWFFVQVWNYAEHRKISVGLTCWRHKWRWKTNEKGEKLWRVI